MPIRKKFILISTIIFLSGGALFCFVSWKKSTVGNLEQFNEWLNAPANGCIGLRKIAGVRISCKYQPPQYIALKDRNNPGVSAMKEGANIENSLARQNKMLTFLLTIGPDKDLPEQRQAGSVMYEGVANREEYVERVFSTNFYMEQNLTLYVDNEIYKPALCILENVYELSDQRNFIVTFVGDKVKNINDGKEYILEYDDPYFEMGKVQFRFESTDLNNAKNIKVIN